MRHFLHLEYNGTPFHGWQRQPNAVSVQQVIEEALSTVLRRPTEIVGAGRTDAGVHAKCMYAHFDDGDTPFDRERLLVSLNRLIGRDIAIHDIIPVRDDAHARFDATSRTYKYFITHAKDPFLNGLAWHCPSSLDYDRMNEAATLLPETADFTSFAKLHSDAKTNICRVTEAFFCEVAPGKHVFTISADRFLRNMVRAVVGTLVEIGRGKMSIDGLKNVIDSKDRCAAGMSMPAQGLYLWNITYPEEIWTPKKE